MSTECPRTRLLDTCPSVHDPRGMDGRTERLPHPQSASPGLVATGGGVVAVTVEGLIHCCSPRFASVETAD